MDSKDINLGKLLEITEDNLNILECFSTKSNTCSIKESCELKPIINDALNSFKHKLYEYTLEDILKKRCFFNILNIKASTLKYL